MAVERDRPYVQFNFLVDLGDGVTDGPRAGFEQVSGLGTSVDVIEYRNGNAHDTIQVEIEGLATKPAPARGGGIVRYRHWVKNQRGETIMEYDVARLIRGKEKS